MERARKSSEYQNVDRLSALPDSVICHILSFLPTQRSVQTSVLAKRWRTLWTHIPVLFLDYFEYSGSRTKSFPCIICPIMLHHKVQNLITFRLVCPYVVVGDDDDDNDEADHDDYELETCIAIVVERNVQNLHLDVRVEVPRCLLTCKTLVDLTLYFDVSVPPTAPISFPNLKKLHLWDLKCEVDLTRLLYGCPVLEELIIGGTKCRDPRGCYISSPILKRLTIIHFLDSSMFDNPDYMVTINTPVLRYLKVNDESCKHISVLPCIYLVEADIKIHSLCEPDDFHHFRCVLKLLDSISNVKCLRLRGSCGEICSGLMLGSIGKFGNLTKLELCAPWCFLPKFLKTANHLQVLTISQSFISRDSWYPKHWMEPIEEQCACLLYSLRTVRIVDFTHKAQSYNMVRYILRNALVLKRMVINWERYPGVGLEQKSS